jgi:glucose/arabinose dehydrogenase
LNSTASIKIKKELVADQLSFPTSICFDELGIPYLTTAGLPWDGAKKGGAVFKINSNGKVETIAEGFGYPVNGICFHKDSFIISDGGFPGRICRLTPDGNLSTILGDLPGLGNYHTNMVAIGPDEKIYFSQGTLTNTGVIGMDAYELGWLGRLPHNCDIPGFNIVLSGQNFETVNPLAQNGEVKANTGVFSPFDTASKPGQKLKANLPCTASIMCCNMDGTGLELVAWGVRNAYGMGFLPDGRLIVTDQGADDRGSRPVGNAPDLLLEIKKGAWYGWPDYIAGIPITDPKYTPQRGPKPKFVLQNHEDLPKPEKPLMEFPVNAAAVKFDHLPEGAPCHGGQLIVALFGDEKPMTAPPGKKVGRNIARINPEDWTLHPLPDLGLERPIDVKYNPVDKKLYVLDFGYFEMTGVGVDAKNASGKLWKIDLETLCD